VPRMRVADVTSTYEASVPEHITKLGLPTKEGPQPSAATKAATKLLAMNDSENSAIVLSDFGLSNPTHIITGRE